MRTENTDQIARISSDISLFTYASRYTQSTLVISKSKVLSEIVRDIRTSTYQICRTEEKLNQTTKVHK